MTTRGPQTKKIQKAYAEMQKYQWAVPAEMDDDQSFWEKCFKTEIFTSL